MKILLILMLSVFSIPPHTQDEAQIYLDTENQRNIPRHSAHIDLLREQARLYNISITRLPDEYLPRLTIHFPDDDQTRGGIALDPNTSPSPLLDLEIVFPLPAEAPSLELLRASILYLTGQCDELPEDSTFEHALALSMNCAIQQGEYQVALDIYEALDTPDDTLHFNAAWLYLQVNQPETTFQILDEIVTKYATDNSSQGHVNALTFRAQLHALNFDYDAAIADMDTAIALDPDNPALYVTRGQMVLLLYEWDRVEANYNAALDLDSTYAPAYYYRGILYYTVLERENALVDFEQYLDLAPTGEYATDAARYAESIRAELDALGGD